MQLRSCECDDRGFFLSTLKQQRRKRKLATESDYIVDDDRRRATATEGYVCDDWVSLAMEGIGNNDVTNQGDIWRNIRHWNRRRMDACIGVEVLVLLSHNWKEGVWTEQVALTLRVTLTLRQDRVRGCGERMW